MSVPAAYLGIVLIWSTTPLAVQWSQQGSSFAFAVFARIALGACVAAALLLVLRIRFALHPRARRAYLASGLGLFLAMSLIYWSATRVPSGLIAVVFGLAPLVADLFAALWLGERSLTRLRLAGTALGLGGLALIFLQGEALGGAQALGGLLALLVAVTIHSGFLVLIKRIGHDGPPLASTFGMLTVALPLFALLWWLTDGSVPAALPQRAALAIAYLAVPGSVLAFALYYYVLKHMAASTVALVTLITPVLALLLGSALNDEAVGPRVWVGTGLILCGLAMHQCGTLLRRSPPAQGTSRRRSRSAGAADSMKALTREETSRECG